MFDLHHLKLWIQKGGGIRCQKVVVFFEIMGLFVGILFLLWFKMIFIPHFGVPSKDYPSRIFLFWETPLIYITFSMGSIFLRNGFLKSFCIGTQVSIFSITTYQFIRLGSIILLSEVFTRNNMFVMTMLSLILFYSIRKIWISIINLRVQQIPGIYAIAQFPVNENFSGKFHDNPTFFFATTRTCDSLSVITESAIFLQNYPMYNNLILFEFLESNLNGRPTVLFPKILHILDTVSIPHFSVSTFDKNYVLFDREHLISAHRVWKNSGVKIIT